MIHLRDITTGHEERIVTKKAIRYVYVATSHCGLTRPAETLHRAEPGKLILGDVCPECLSAMERRERRILSLRSPRL